jgi:hypothetical protein
VIPWDSKKISWNRIENSTRPNDFSIHPLEADTRSDRAKTRQDQTTSRYIRLRRTLEVTGRELEKLKLFTFKPQSYFSIHPLEADTRSDRVRTRQAQTTSRYNSI